MAFTYLTATFGTAELLVVDIVVAYAYFSLEVPVAREHPLIAVGDTAAGIPAFIAVVSEALGYILAAEKAPGKGIFMLAALNCPPIA